MCEFSDCFGKIGTLKNAQQIEIKDNVSSVLTAVRKIPLALKPKLEKESKCMVDLDIIPTVQKPTDWVNGLVVVEKPNGLDLRPLNNVIEREHLHLRTAEEIGTSYFSKLDASCGYLQIKVDQQSSNLLTFGTSSGRYCFKRLLYGIHSASEVFQREVTSIISDILGSANSQDDFAIWGKLYRNMTNA